MLEEMKREQSESHKLTWSLNLFNHEYSEGERKDIGHCSALETYEYHTEGSTALLDAVGKMLVSLEKNLENQDVQVLVLVITDGEENASSEWSKSSVKSLVSRSQTANLHRAHAPATRLDQDALRTQLPIRLRLQRLLQTRHRMRVHRARRQIRKIRR